MSQTLDRVVKEVVLPTDILTLYKFGLINTEDTIKNLENFVENHDHKDNCTCSALRPLIKALKDIHAV